MFGLQASSQPKFTDPGLVGNTNYTYNNNASVRLGATMQKTAYHQGLMNTHKDLSQWRKDAASVAQVQDRVLPVRIVSWHRVR